MPNNNVAILSIMSKFDEKSAREAAQRANKVYDEALSDIGNVNFDKKLLDNFDKAMNLLKNKFKKVNLSSYTNNLLDSIFSDKDISEKSKDIESFIKKIDLLKKASSGQDINAFNTFSAKQIEALISRTEKLAQKQDEINEKTREYNREATKIAKTNRSISTIDKNYGNQDYSKTLESLKKSLGTEKEFTAEQNQSIENLAKMVNLYQTMEKSEPQKGTAEAIRYSKDLLAVTQKIKEERDKIDAFSQKGASTYINNNGLSSIDKVSDYTVNKSKEDFVKASLSNLKTQEAKLQSELTTYISESVQKNLEKVSKEVDAVVDKAEKRVENLQNKIDSLQSKPTNTGIDNSLIGNVVSESDVKTLEEIKNRLYEISKIDANGDATNQQLKEYIRLFKQYEKLALNDPGTQFDLELKEEYDSIIKYNNGLKKYADTLDNVVSKQKEFNDFSSNNQLNKKSDKSDFVDAGKIETDLNEIKETIIEISKKVDNLNSENSFNELSSQVSTLDEKLNGVNGSVDKLVESIQLLSSLSLSDLQKTLIPIYNGINQVYQDKNGKQISGYWDDLKSEIENSNTALKELLSNIGLLNNSTNSVKLIDSGLNNSGGIIGDRATIIARKNDTLSGQSQYDKSTTLKAKLDEAYEAGVNVARILDIIGTKESKVILEVQETQIGGMLGNDNLEDITKSYVNKEYLEATDEQILKLIQDIQTLEKIGLSVDLNSNNLFYDKDKGFSIIDLSTDGQFFKSYEDMIEELGYAMQGTTRQIFEDLNNIEDEPLLKAFEERFTKLSKQAQDAYANAQDSNSPSKEFEKLENDAVDGIVVGANENEEKLKNVGRQMAENVKAGFKEGISEIGSEASSDKSNISSENSIPQAVNQQEQLREAVLDTATAYEKMTEAEKEARKSAIQTAVNSIPQAENTARYVHWGNIDQSKSILSNPNGMSTGDYGLISSFADCLGEAETSMEAIYKYWESLHAEGFDKGSALVIDIPLDEVKEFERGLKDNIPQEYIKGFVDTESNAITLNTTLQNGLKETAEQAEKTAQSVQDISKTQMKDVFQGDDKANNSNVSFRSNLDDIEKEKSALLELRNTISLIIEEIDRKTQAFHNEKSAIDMIIPAEIAILESLEGELKIIIESIEQISKIPINIDFNLEKLDENSANAISKLKDSLSGFDGSSLTNISSILEGFKISKANVDNLQKLANAILTLKSNLNNVGNSGQQFLSDIKELVYQSDGLKDLATVLKASKKQIDTAKKTTNTDNQKTEENANAWEELTYSIQRYTEVSKRIANGKVLEGDVEEAERLENKISQLQKLDILSPTQIEKSEQMLIKLYDKLDDIERKAQKNRKESLESDVKWYNDDFEKKNAKPSNDNRSAEYTQKLSEYKSLIEQLEAISKLDIINENDIKDADKLKEKLKSCINELNSFSASQKGSTPLSRGKTIEWANDLLKQNTKWSKAAKIEVQGWIDKLATADPSNVEEIRNEILKIVRLEREAGNEGRTWLDIFKDKKLYSFLGQAASMFSFYDLINVGREGFQTIRELDTALVDLKKTTAMNSSQLEEFYYDSNDVAKQMGVTTQAIIDQASAWSRLGFSTKEQATQMAELSAQFVAISPDLDLDSATDGLVSSMKAFDIEVSNVERDIMDNINRIGNTAATSNGEIVDMLTRSSAAMAAANNTIQETIALETAAVEITRNAETTGTAFKTLSMRIRGYDEETEELSDDLKNISGDIADLTKTASTPGGISLFTDETKQTYKSTYQILKEISDIYDELSDKNRAELLEKLAGKRGGQVVAGLLSNFDAAEKALKEMESAAGSADAEMSIIEQSLEFKLNALKQTWVGTAQAIVDRGDLGTAIDGLTKLSEAIGWVIEKTGGLSTILGASSGIALNKMLG